jgi:hypothetical protein
LTEEHPAYEKASELKNTFTPVQNFVYLSAYTTQMVMAGNLEILDFKAISPGTKAEVAFFILCVFRLFYKIVIYLFGLGRINKGVKRSGTNIS